MQAAIRVLGIDPGLRNLGWGIIDVAGSRLTHVACGIIHSDGDDLSLRLLCLHRGLTAVIARYAPTAAAVEQTFVNKDAVATLKLGQARGIALLVPAQAGLAVGEYAPNAVKKAVVGVGHADKAQVGAYGAAAVAGRGSGGAGRGRRAGHRDLPRASPAIGGAAGGRDRGVPHDRAHRGRGPAQARPIMC